MCYTILVIEKYCRRKHIQAAKLCWRQCKAQAATSYQSKHWCQLCDHRKRTDVQLEAWYRFAPQVSDPICDVCMKLESDHEARELRAVLDPADEFITDCERAMEEQKEAQRKIKDVLLPDSSVDDPKYVRMAEEYFSLHTTRRFVQMNVDRKLDQVKEAQKEYDKIERYYESIYCDPILDIAVAMFDRRFMIYMGRPDEVEKKKLNCPRYCLRCDPEASEILVC